MTVPDFLPGQAAAEPLRMLAQIPGRWMFYRSTKEQLKQTIEELFPIMQLQEVKHSGIELPADQLFQLFRVYDELCNRPDLCHRIIRSSHWNAYRNLQYARVLEKINKKITSFVRGSMQVNMPVHLHRLTLAITEGFDRLQDTADSLEGVLRSRDG